MSLLERVKPEYKAIFEHSILSDEDRLGEIPFKTIEKIAVLIWDQGSIAELKGMFTDGIVSYNEARLSVDYTNDETSQPVKADFKFEIGTTVYDIYVKGTAKCVIHDYPSADLDVPDQSNLEFDHIDDLDFNIYTEDGKEVSIFNLDITEDQIEEILKELCC